jgi:hypothetical protein
MSRVRVHNFSISLDGFATGEGQAADTPFGHAGHRLHEWMLATRFWDATGLGGDGARRAGNAGVDNAFAERHGHGIGAEIMGAGSSALRLAGRPGVARVVGTTRRSTHRRTSDPSPRPPLEMDGGTTHFLRPRRRTRSRLTSGSRGKDVRIGGGPTMLGEFAAGS